MKQRARILRLRRMFFGRVARNLWFWLILLYIADAYNSGNDAAFHYGLKSSGKYLQVMAAMLVLQCALMYTNNLVLVPRLLARQRVLLYVPAVLLLCFLTGLGTAAVMKLAVPYIRVEHLHHVGFAMIPVSREWNFASLLGEAGEFAFSDIFWAGAFTLAWYANDYVRQQRALRESEALRLKTELAFLRNQLNPHFLFNTLNNIYGLVYLKSDAAPELVLKLSALLRYLLYETDIEAIAFSRERAAIEAYVEIESLRLPDNAQLHLDLMADQDYLIPPLLWMPVLENSFKHGARLIHKPVSLDFCFRIEKGRILIRASNHFEIPAAPAAEGRGLGLNILRKRLNILYAGRYTIEQQQSDNVYSILIEINLNAHATARPHRR